MRPRNDAIISMDHLIHGRLYRIYARNFRLGVWDESKKVFIGIRTKFGSRFLDREYHWDASRMFGTAQPYEELRDSWFGEMPLFGAVDLDTDEASLFQWLESKEKLYLETRTGAES